MPRVAQAAFDAGKDRFGHRARRPRGAFPAALATIMTRKKSAQAKSALPELTRDVRSGERRADRPRDVERDRTEHDRARHVGAADEIVDGRRLGRQVECETRADQECEGEQRPRRDRAGSVMTPSVAVAAKRVICVIRMSRRRSTRSARAPAKSPSSSDGAVLADLDERHHQCGRRQRRHQPGDDRRLRRVAERCADRPDVELPEGAVPERGRVKELRGERGDAIRHADSVAWRRSAPGIGRRRSADIARPRVASVGRQEGREQP